MINISNEDVNKIEAEMGLTFDEERRNVLKSFDDVQACPGSGKTTLIAAKLIVLAKKWPYKYRGTCVLSHTNVAKNEIIHRLEKHSAGVNLLKYPHFIGTVQEFVNRFLAIPYLRSNQTPVFQIDDANCVEIIRRKITPSTRSYFSNRRNASFSELQYVFSDGNLSLKFPGNLKNPKSLSYQDLETVKFQLKEDGYHFYNEMYEYAKAAIALEIELVEALRYRFPFVFVDEMQDTNKTQDELINQIFSHEECFMQRFGDPDQAIFDGMSNAPNETYNSVNLTAIATTHRFSSQIARLTSGISFKGLQLQSTKERSLSSMPHTIFLVDESSRQTVISEFAKLCAANISINDTSPIKAIGAIGRENQEGLTLRHYFPAFDKSKSITNFKPSRLIQYFIPESLKDSYHNSTEYSRALDGVTECMRLAENKITAPDGKERLCTRNMVKHWLNVSGKKREFNLLLLDFQVGSIWDEEKWTVVCKHLLNLLEINPTLPSIQKFISFEEVNNQVVKRGLPANKFTLKGLPVVEIGTIHSVKGETHAATLVLETKYRKLYDISSVLRYLLKEKHANLEGDKLKLMKQLYVAMTRPKHLLCLALDKSRFTEKDRARASELGWKITTL